MIKLFLLLSTFYSFSIFSQPISYTKYVDTLCSEFFKGRGYVDNGHFKAATFLANEFSNIGLDSLNNKGYLQKFNISVNTFPEKITLKINDSVLIPGQDYFVDPSSGSSKGVFKMVKVNLNNWKSFLGNGINKEQLFLSIDISNILNKDTLSLYNELKKILSRHYPILWTSPKKLQWSVAQYELPYPLIYVQSGVIKDKISSIEIDLNNEFISLLETHNIVGQLKGKNKKSIIISAHYDHLGMMGEVMFPGANDNASGISLLLNLANYYVENKPKYNIVFICFGAEEVGLLGSKFYVENPLNKLTKVKLLVNLDIVGTGEDGIAVVNAFEQKKAAKLIGKINNNLEFFSKIKLRAQAPNSDHYWFSQKNIPAIFIYTMGGIKAYHDPYDKSNTLPLNKVEDLKKLITNLISRI